MIIANTSHEIRTPLNAILGFSLVLLCFCIQSSYPPRPSFSLLAPTTFVSLPPLLPCLIAHTESVGMMEMLADTCLDQEQTDMVQTMDQSSKLLMKIVDDILVGKRFLPSFPSSFLLVYFFILPQLPLI